MKIFSFLLFLGITQTVHSGNYYKADLRDGMSVKVCFEPKALHSQSNVDQNPNIETLHGSIMLTGIIGLASVYIGWKLYQKLITAKQPK